MNCPCCGQPMAGGLSVRVSVEANTVSVGKKAVRLSPLETEILAVLDEGRPLPVTKDRLIRRVFGVLESEGASISVQVAISRMRKKIEPLGLQIINQKPHNEGGRTAEGSYSLVAK